MTRKNKHINFSLLKSRTAAVLFPVFVLFTGKSSSAGAAGRRAAHTQRHFLCECVCFLPLKHSRTTNPINYPQNTGTAHKPSLSRLRIRPAANAKPRREGFLALFLHKVRANIKFFTRCQAKILWMHLLGCACESCQHFLESSADRDCQIPLELLRIIVECIWLESEIAFNRNCWWARRRVCCNPFAGGKDKLPKCWGFEIKFTFQVSPSAVVLWREKMKKPNIHIAVTYYG